jgi:hypothetical protein
VHQEIAIGAERVTILLERRREMVRVHIAGLQLVHHSGKAFLLVCHGEDLLLYFLYLPLRACKVFVELFNVAYLLFYRAAGQLEVGFGRSIPV